MSHLDHCRSTLMAALKHHRPTFQLDADNELLLEELAMWLACDQNGLTAHWREHAARTIEGEPEGAPLDPQRGILITGQPGRGKSLFLTALGAAKRHIEGFDAGFKTVAARQVARNFQLNGEPSLFAYESGDLHLSDVGTEDDVRYKGYPPAVNTIAKVIECRWVPWERAVAPGNAFEAPVPQHKQDLTFIDTNLNRAELNKRYTADGKPRFTSRLSAMMRATVLGGRDWRPFVPAVVHRRPPVPAPPPLERKPLSPEMSAKHKAFMEEFMRNKVPHTPVGTKLRGSLSVPEEHRPAANGTLTRFRETLHAMNVEELIVLRRRVVQQLEASKPFTDMIDEELKAASIETAQPAPDKAPLQDQDAEGGAVSPSDGTTCMCGVHLDACDPEECPAATQHPKSNATTQDSPA